MENRENRIIKNSLIFTVGNLGSKVLSYILVLFYTHYISSEELGFYDVVMTTVSLLLPIVMLSFDEGIYRWLIDAKESDKKVILATCVKTILIICIVASVVYILVLSQYHIPYFIEILLLFLTLLLYNLILNAVRGLSNNKLYAASGIINSVLILLFDVVGLAVFNCGIEALIISKIIANICTILHIYFRQQELHYILKTSANKKLAKNIAKYTIPLIPNSVSWWIVNSSDRYIILFFLGQTFNGLYTVANKFPTVITTVSGILYFAFQEAVIKEYHSPDRDVFYSKIFEKYYTFLFSLVVCGIPLTKLTIQYLTGSEYTLAWKYTGFLFLSTVFSAMSSFLGIGYQISRDTKRSAYTTVIAAVVNIGINFMAIRWIGLHAAALSTLLAYMILFLLRIKHSQSYFNLEIRWLKLGGMFAICLLCIAMTYVGSIYIVCSTFVMGLVFLLFYNKEFILIVIRKFLRKL